MSTLRALTGLSAAVLLFASACGGDSESGGGSQVAVTASDSACEVSDTELDAGPVTFNVTNEGSQVTEVYVYGEEDGEFSRIINEVENIGPGTSQDLSVDLSAGTYEVACKPGQTGEGIRQEITVTGEGGSANEGEEAYDREIELTVTDDGLEGAEDLTAEVGETLEFVLQNETDQTYELEIIGVGQSPLGQEQAPADGEGKFIVELPQAGQYTLRVHLLGDAETGFTERMRVE